MFVNQHLSPAFLQTCQLPTYDLIYPISNLCVLQLNPTYTAFTNDLLGSECKKSAWYLQLMGVEPSCQGQGIGSALLRYGEDSVRTSPKVF